MKKRVPRPTRRTKKKTTPKGSKRSPKAAATPPSGSEGVKGAKVAGKGMSGRAVVFEEPEPWPDPVDGGELLDEIANLLRQYLFMPDGAAEVMSLWIAHSYYINKWDRTGYLALVSSAKRCGKTTALRIIHSLVPRPITADNISPAALYRVIERDSPTLLIDEVDRIDRYSDIWQIINSGHVRGGTSIRCAGDESEPRAYSTFGAKVLAYIRRDKTNVPDTVEDRTIPVILNRRPTTLQLPKLRSHQLDVETAPLRRKLVRWAQDNDNALPGKSPIIPDALGDRAADCWEPLLAVAEVVGGKWPAVARELAVRFSADRAEDEVITTDALLLRDIRTLFDEGKNFSDELGVIGIKLVFHLQQIPGSPWKALPYPNGINETSLASLLKSHGVQPMQVGPKEKRRRRYDEVQLRALCGAHPPTAGPTPTHPNTEGPGTDSSNGGVGV
jgi:putative DNA primase/helicase